MFSRKYLKIVLFFLLSFALNLKAQQAIVYKGKIYSFTLYCDTSKCISDGTKSEDSIVVKEIASGKTVQVIIPSANGIPCSNMDDAQFKVVDANFDGYDDFMALQFLPANPNLPYFFWLYNVVDKKFEEDTVLESITSPVFDTIKKEIYSTWMASCCDHGTDTYQYTKGKLVLMEQDEDIYDAESKKHISIVRKQENGQLMEVSRKTENYTDSDN